MANEVTWVIQPTKIYQMNVADGQTIEEGTLCGIGTSPVIASGSFAVTTRGSMPFAGVSVTEKVAGDTRTTIGLALDGEGLCYAATAVTLGNVVTLSGANQVVQAGWQEVASGAYVGKCLQTATPGSTVRVRFGDF